MPYGPRIRTMSRMNLLRGFHGADDGQLEDPDGESSFEEHPSLRSTKSHLASIKTLIFDLRGCPRSKLGQ